MRLHINNVGDRFLFYEIYLFVQFSNGCKITVTDLKSNDRI